MKKIYLFIVVLFICQNIKGQIFEYETGINAKGEKYAETKAMDPQKVIEQKGNEIYLLGNMHLRIGDKVGPVLYFMVWDFWECDPLKRVEKLLNMTNGTLKITLADGEVLSTQYLGSLNMHPKIGVEAAIEIYFWGLDTSDPKYNQLETNKKIAYMVNRFCFDDIKKIQVNDVVFNFSKNIEAKGSFPFKTAETFKSMIKVLLNK